MIEKMDEAIDLISCFTSLSGFISNYKTLLSKRLLYKESINIGIEKYFFNKLESTFGTNFV